ncbi:MAG TPA: SRPBCC domain-containing protein [Gemmatimonadales bacterium]|nr:SRPBCC domain-containing protein [Gemmatimonadales bacterium]
MKLEFSGAPEVAAPRDRVWRRVTDPRFVARSVPGVESVAVIDPTHFSVTSGFGLGSLKARLILDGELFDIVPGTSAKMRLRGTAGASSIDVLSNITLLNAAAGNVRLSWSATSELTGPLSKAGSGLIGGVARKLTEQFWADLARRVTDE